jgi:threonine/homoserine/homoserine lactone efflux protein
LYLYHQTIAADNAVMISAENLAAFWLFAIVASGTPGPNNMLVLASSTRSGFMRNVPLILGIAMGVFVLIVAVGSGLNTLIEAIPQLYQVLQIVGASYLLYLAWRIANAGVMSSADAQHRPLGFSNGALFQLVNPKAWMIALSIVSTYTPKDQFLANVLLLALIFSLTAMATLCLWATFGAALRQCLSDPALAIWCNRAMGIGLVLAVIPILIAN